MRAPILIAAVFAALLPSFAQLPVEAPPLHATQPDPSQPGLSGDQVLRALDDVMWMMKLSDVAYVDKVAYTGPPPSKIPNHAAAGAGNPVVIHAYTFIPRKLDRTRKQPLLVLAHQGIHGNVSSAELAHIIRELMEQGYSVIAADYRGSSGYGQ
jgi:predicted alpha/beta-fold hydrolase